MIDLRVAVLVLDRVFDGDDVPRLGAIDLADQRRQRRRFAGACRSADQHQPALRLHQLRQRRRQAQLRQRRDLRRQRADRGGQRAALAVHVHAEAPRAAVIVGCAAREAQREVGRAVGLQLLAHAAGDDAGQAASGCRPSTAVRPPLRASRPPMRKTGGAPATSSRSLAPRCAISMSRLSRAFPSGMLARRCPRQNRARFGLPASPPSSASLSSRTRASSCGSRISFCHHESSTNEPCQRYRRNLLDPAVRF